MVSRDSRGRADDQGRLYSVNKKRVGKRVRLQLILCVKKMSCVEFKAVEVNLTIMLNS